MYKEFSSIIFPYVSFLICRYIVPYKATFRKHIFFNILMQQNIYQPRTQYKFPIHFHYPELQNAIKTNPLFPTLIRPKMGTHFHFRTYNITYKIFPNKKNHTHIQKIALSWRKPWLVRFCMNLNRAEKARGRTIETSLTANIIRSVASSSFAMLFMNLSRLLAVL